MCSHSFIEIFLVVISYTIIVVINHRCFTATSYFLLDQSSAVLLGGQILIYCRGQRSKNLKLLCTNVSSQSALKTNALQKTPHLLIINCFLCVHLENICIISIWHIFAQTRHRHPIHLIWNVCSAFLIYLFFSVSVLCLSCFWLYVVF